MYHISSDPRAKASADKILNAMEACLEQKKLMDVSVSEVCSTAQVGRATFYRLFDNLIDVLQYYSDEARKRIYEKLISQPELTEKEHFIQSLEELMKQSQLLDAIMANDRWDIIYQSHLKYKDHVQQVASRLVDIDDMQMDYLLYQISVVISTALRVWYLHGKKETAEHIYEATRNNCMLMAYLLK